MKLKTSVTKNRVTILVSSILFVVVVILFIRQFRAMKLDIRNLQDDQRTCYVYPNIMEIEGRMNKLEVEWKQSRCDHSSTSFFPVPMAVHEKCIDSEGVACWMPTIEIMYQEKCDRCGKIFRDYLTKDQLCDKNFLKKLRESR